MGKKNVFSAHTVTDSKRVARANLYQDILADRCLNPEGYSADRVLILPGRAAAEEINLVRELLGDVHITAVDRDPVAIDAAVEAGVNSWYKGSLENFLETFNEEFSVANLDFCGVTSKAVKAAAAMQAVCHGAISVTFLCAREPSDMYAKLGVNYLRCYPPPYHMDTPEDVLKPAVFGRLLFAMREMEPWWPSGVTYYQGYGGSPMAQILFHPPTASFGVRCDYTKVKDKDLGSEVLDWATAIDDESAKRVYAVDQRRLAAFKAAASKKRGQDG